MSLYTTKTALILTALMAVTSAADAGTYQFRLPAVGVAPKDFVAPTLGAWSLSSHTVDEGSFTLTPPPSNSAGAFTYASSNPAVATVTGNTVTLVSPGSTTITATQAASGNYLAGSTSASFSVTNPVAPTYGAWTLPLKNMGDAPFTLTPPASSSPGAFTHYESNNPGIASISGNTVTIHASGLVYITAYQAASTGFTTGATTTALNISPPAGWVVHNGKTYTKPDGALRSWSAANSYCQNLIAGGQSDWVLPTSSPLSDMVKSVEPDINKGWPTNSPWLWTSTVIGGTTAEHVAVVTETAGAGSRADSNMFLTTCTR